MNPIEESLRRALEGGDSSDPAFRQSIYAASVRAMERMIDARGLDEERANAERARLHGVMERVEGEYAVHYDAHTGEAGAPGQNGAETWADAHHSSQDDPRQSAHGAPTGGGAQTHRAPASFAAPAAVQETQAEGDTWTPGSGQTGSRRKPAAGKGRMLWLLVVLLLFAIFVYVMVGWFSANPGATPGEEPASVTGEAPAETGTNADTASEPTETAEATGETAAGSPWIDVFSGANLQQIAAPAGARVTGITDLDRPAVRIAGPIQPDGASESGAEALITLGAGLVDDFAGSDVRVEIVAGSPDDQLREFSVRCLFDEESVCDRQRFATARSEEAFVFDVAVPEGATAPAQLAIGPGLSPEGPDVDLYSIRMRVL